MLSHDDIIDAFKRADPNVVTCDRGGLPPAYTHVHSPSQAIGAKQCNSHWIVVERANGTVALRGQLAQRLGATLRPVRPINARPAGHSAGPKFGAFDRALDPASIAGRWPTADDLVKEVLFAARSLGVW